MRAWRTNRVGYWKCAPCPASGYKMSSALGRNCCKMQELIVGGEGITQSRVVVIQGAHEVLEEHQRRTFGHPETAVGEAYPASLNVPG